MRLYFYCLAAVCSALIGWNLGQFVLDDLGWLVTLPEVVLFPYVAVSLAVGIVTNEVLISNPTRPKINFRILKSCLLIAVALGLGIGLLAGGLVQFLFIPSLAIPSFIIRVSGWIIIGIAVGLAEGFTWRRRSIEAGNPKRSRRRIFASVTSAVFASAIAALLFELLRLGIGTLPLAFRNLEDPLGFSLLGLLLGIAFSVTSSPSYMAALRAGSGFEFRQIEPDAIDTVGIETSALSFPYVSQSSQLQFVGGQENNRVEEGMSIQLPARGKIRIGSATRKEPDIYLPGVALHVADLEIHPRHAVLDPNQTAFETIEVNGIPLRSRRPVMLKHNSLLTFHALNQSDPYAKKLYRLVYYNRFLDPQA
ncbi:MAG: hypothetical protein DCF15_19700 [Phormidesmis priestleyi]|uniref:FHA domain-containing protein n=1 Tax=Phormidesmis priestleyi TaxID=268141 RepID=A0A2W4YVR3_9CYAN|nr:MAG: hypothetical protein DCF15_19700 [Phormidesmis priestleyi]